MPNRQILQQGLRLWSQTQCTSAGHYIQRVVEQSTVFMLSAHLLKSVNELQQLLCSPSRKTKDEKALQGMDGHLEAHL